MITQSSTYTDTDETRSDEDFEVECRETHQIDGVTILSHANLHTVLWWLINYGDYNGTLSFLLTSAYLP